MMGDEIRHRGLERGEGSIVAGLPQARQRRLGEVLVIRPDLRRDVDKFDVRRSAAGGAERIYQIEKAARLAAADIVYPAVATLTPQPQHRRDTILRIDEIAPLLAIAIIRAMRLEQPDRLTRRDLAVVLGDEAHHVALVVLVGPEHVEEFEPGAMRRRRAGGRLPGRAQVERVLRRPVTGE